MVNTFYFHDVQHLVDDAATHLVALEAMLEQEDVDEARHFLHTAQGMLENALRRIERAAV